MAFSRLVDDAIIFVPGKDAEVVKVTIIVTGDEQLSPGAVSMLMTHVMHCIVVGNDDRIRVLDSVGIPAAVHVNSCETCCTDILNVALAALLQYGCQVSGMFVSVGSFQPTWIGN